MIKNATDEELVEALNNHLLVTKMHVTRLEEVFATIGEKATAEKCVAMEGLIKEAEEIMEETEMGSVRDAGIIAAAQKVEHYEIATYGGLVSLARTRGKDDVADILATTLEEEKQTDEGLTEIAENNINWEAEQEGAEEQD